MIGCFGLGCFGLGLSGFGLEFGDGGVVFGFGVFFLDTLFWDFKFEHIFYCSDVGLLSCFFYSFF